MQLSPLKLWLEYQFLKVHKKLDTLQNEVKKKYMYMKKVSMMFKVLHNCKVMARAHKSLLKLFYLRFSLMWQRRLSVTLVGSAVAVGQDLMTAVVM